MVSHRFTRKQLLLGIARLLRNVNDGVLQL